MADWRSYDSHGDVAEAYERVHAARFAVVARDLASLAGVGPGARVLDVGTGTGVAAEAAADAGAAAVGIDPAPGMLAVGTRVRPAVRFAAAEAIDLPFRDGIFDAVLGNFVVGHFTRYTTALFDMVRVLGSGGNLALSAWADARDDLQDTWMSLAESVAPPEVLRSAINKAYPWGERFSSPEKLDQALRDAGLARVRIERREYRFRYGIDEYVEGLASLTIGRFLREMLGEGDWPSFLERARRTFAERFSDPLNDFRRANLAVGTKP
jgi:ubiquinone/menaquinone biosynthesis C-methylase UbiE